jgi:hypothetical protein
LHGVFFTHPRETIRYHYERNAADPRIGHTLTLEVDEYGNVLKQAEVGYGRRSMLRVLNALGQPQLVPNPGLEALLPVDQARQTTRLLTYSENRVANFVGAPGIHRNPFPCETRTFELTGYTPSGPAGRFTAADFVEPDSTRPGRLRHRFLIEVPYEATASGSQCRRVIECERTLFRKDDLTGLLALGEIQSLAIPGGKVFARFYTGLAQSDFSATHRRATTRKPVAEPGVGLSGTGRESGGISGKPDFEGRRAFPQRRSKRTLVDLFGTRLFQYQFHGERGYRVDGGPAKLLSNAPNS